MKSISPKVLAYRIKLASRHPTASMTPEEIIAEALKHKVYLAFSGGRCSQVARARAREVAKKNPANAILMLVTYLKIKESKE